MSFKYDLAKFIPYRDQTVCERVRAITRNDIAAHPNPDFHIRIEDDPAQFYFQFGWDIVRRMLDADYEELPFVCILPVGPMPQYQYAVKLIN
jgi:glucosamine-6-phosphate deaminase